MTAGESPGAWNLIALSRTPYGGGSGASAPERTGSTTHTGLQPEPARSCSFASAGGDTYHGDRWVLGVILVSELSSLCGRMGGSVQTEPKAVWPSTQRMWTWASGSVHYKLLFSPVLYCTSPTGTGGRHGLNRRSVPRGAAASGAWVLPRCPGWADLIGASLRHRAAVALWASCPLWNPDFSSAECGWKQACLTGRREDKKRGGCGLLLSLNGWRAFSIQEKF